MSDATLGGENHDKEENGGKKGSLSRPVGVKQLPGPSLPKLMAQFDPEQTGWRKTTPRPFFTQTDGTV